MHRTPPRVTVAALAVLAAALAPPPEASALSDRLFLRPPYVHGASPAPEARAAHLGVRFDDGGDRLGLDASMRAALERLVVALDGHLDTLGLSVAIALDDPARGAPDVVGGCVRGATGPENLDVSPEDCDPAERRVRLAVSGPSKAWRGRAAAAAREAGAGALLVVTLERSEQYVRQKNWKGEKGLDLGTGHSVAMPWFTGLETPAEVLVLTGAVLDAAGRVVAMGMEGLLARRTGMAAGSVGAAETLRPADVDALVADARRDELEGAPLVREVALENLVAQLLGRPDRVRR